MNGAKQAVIADAERAGYTIERHDTCVDIVKRTKHAKPRVAIALRIFEDGTAFDATMDLSNGKIVLHTAHTANSRASAFFRTSSTLTRLYFPIFTVGQ